MKYILLNVLLFTSALRCQADTIDVWCISINDSCLIQANQNYFNEGKEIIYIRNEDKDNTYEVNYRRDVGYETKRNLHFYYKGAECYHVQFAQESNSKPIEFKLREVLYNLSEIDSGGIIEIYYSEQNEHFSNDRIYVGKFIATEKISGQTEKNNSSWFIVATTIMIGIIVLIVKLWKNKKE